MSAPSVFSLCFPSSPLFTSHGLCVAGLQAIALFRSLPAQAPSRIGVQQLLDHVSTG
jgi:hypothetical protein